MVYSKQFIGCLTALLSLSLSSALVVQERQLGPPAVQATLYDKYDCQRPAKQSYVAVDGQTYRLTSGVCQQITFVAGPEQSNVWNAFKGQKEGGALYTCDLVVYTDNNCKTPDVGITNLPAQTTTCTPLSDDDSRIQAARQDYTGSIKASCRPL